MDARPTYDQKLAHILRVAAGIFAEKGYHQASVRDISAGTGVSLSGLYYYFKSKEDLLFLIQRHCFETVLARAREALAGVTDAEERLRVFIRCHLLFFVNNMDEMKVLSHEAESLTGEYREGVSVIRRGYAEELRGIVEALVPDGGVDPRIATYSLFGMMNWVYTWYRVPGDVGVDELVDQMTHLFLSGMRYPRNVEAQAAGQDSDGGMSIWRQPGVGSGIPLAGSDRTP